MSVLPRRRGVVRAMAAALLATLTGVAACGNEPSEIEWPDGVPTATPAHPSPSRTPVDPAEAAATEEILELVSAFRAVEVSAYADPQPPHLARRDLNDYLADPLLSRTLDRLRTMREAGIVVEGQPRFDPVVHELRLDASPPIATVRDCVDASGWQDVFADTGDPVPGDGRPDRYVEWLELTLYDDGWLIHSTGVKEAKEC